MPSVDEALLQRIYSAAGPGTEITLADSPGEAIEAVADVDIILGVITPPLFERSQKLKWVHATTAGADAYLFDAMRESEVLLSGDKGLVGSHLAETAFALLLAITRRLALAVIDGPKSWERRVEYRREEFELWPCRRRVARAPVHERRARVAALHVYARRARWPRVHGGVERLRRGGLRRAIENLRLIEQFFSPELSEEHELIRRARIHHRVELLRARAIAERHRAVVVK